MLFANPRLADDPIFAADPVSAQDYVAQLGQGRIADRTQERLGKTDAGIILMRSLFRREMEAVQRGEPGKQWVYKTDATPLPLPPGVPQAVGAVLPTRAGEPNPYARAIVPRSSP